MEFWFNRERKKKRKIMDTFKIKKRIIVNGKLHLVPMRKTFEVVTVVMKCHTIIY
jgi:hypothetical protein